MYNFNINFNKVIKANLLQDLRIQPFLNLIIAAAKPFKVIHTEFLSLVNLYRRKIRFTSQVMYIEQALNERFDPVLKRIFISDYIPEFFWIFKEEDLDPPVYVFAEWNTDPFLAGEYTQVGFAVYRANINNTNKPPAANPVEWTLQNFEGAVLKTDADFALTNNFTVNVPLAIVFDVAELTSIVTSLKLSGRSFDIKTF